MPGLTLKKIKIRNFLSYGNNANELDLDFTGTSLIVGENLDAGGHNGVGKSTIINAISYALYDKPISNIGKEKLLNRTNNAKNTEMEIILEFEIEGTLFEIRRTRGSKNSVRIVKDGDYDKPITPDSVANTNKFIEELIGLSYELFRRTVVFTGSDVSFFEMGLAAQRNLTEELFKTTKLSEKADVLKKVISDTNKNIEVQSAVITQQQQAKDLRDKHLKEAEARTVSWETDRQNKISDLKKQLEFIESLDYKANEELFEEETKLQEQLSELKEKKSELSEKYNQLYKTFSEENSVKNSLESDIKKLESRLKEVTKELEHLLEAKCPYCLQEFNSKEKIEELRKEEDEINESLKTNRNNLSEQESTVNVANESMTEVRNEMESFTESVDELDQLIITVKSAKSFDSIEKLVEAKESSKHFEAQIKDLEDSENPHLEAYESLLKEKEVKVESEKLDNLKEDLEHQKFLLKLLTDKNSFIRKKIINRTVPFLNGRIREYTSELGLPHLVKFQPDMSCEITEHGRELDYGNLSGGEKKRLNLSVSLAFRDVLQHLHSAINVLIADEIDGGSVDTEGVEAMIHLIKHKAREDNLGIWVISHRPEMAGRFDRELLIQKENGFSNFIEFR